MRRGWLVEVIAWLPQGPLSRAWGWLARRQRPRLAVAALKYVFVRATGIDMAEADAPLASYPSLMALFVRQLRPGSHQVDGRPGVLVSPVDGTVGTCGTVQAGTCLQIKGRSYLLEDLLGSATAAARYEGGSYATIYLAPRDYHRIHAPAAGEVREATWIPGGLMPVFPESLARVPALFARNERIVTYLDTPAAGRLAIVKVGATLVGCIHLAYDPSIASNQAGQHTPRLLCYAPPRPLARGAELGTFCLGSTVVLFAEAGAAVLSPPLLGSPIRMGQALGHIVPRPDA